MYFDALIKFFVEKKRIMAEDKMMRLNIVVRKINVGLQSIVDHLASKGFKVDSSPNTKLNFEHLNELAKFYHRPDLLETEGSVSIVSEKETSSIPSFDDDNDTGIMFFREERPAPKPVVVEPIAIVEPEKPKDVVPEIKPEIMDEPKQEIKEEVKPEIKEEPIVLVLMKE